LSPYFFLRFSRAFGLKELDSDGEPASHLPQW